MTLGSGAPWLPEAQNSGKERPSQIWLRTGVRRKRPAKLPPSVYITTRTSMGNASKSAPKSTPVIGYRHRMNRMAPVPSRPTAEMECFGPPGFQSRRRSALIMR